MSQEHYLNAGGFRKGWLIGLLLVFFCVNEIQTLYASVADSGDATVQNRRQILVRPRQGIIRICSQSMAHIMAMPWRGLTRVCLRFCGAKASKCKQDEQKVLWSKYSFKRAK